MKERPIIFSAPMVRAIQDERKTQTRRIVKPQPDMTRWKSWVAPVGVEYIREDEKGRIWNTHAITHKDTPEGGLPLVGLKCPYGQPGDLLWVREAFYIDLIPYDRGPLPKEAPGISEALYYRADGECCEQIPECCCDEVGPCPWRPSIHMPKWAARIWLEVTGIRVERVQEISEEDSRAEGIIDGGCLNCGESEPCGCSDPQPDARDAFIWLWNSINGKKPGCSWDENPWVWVVEFRRQGK